MSVNSSSSSNDSFVPSNASIQHFYLKCLYSRPTSGIFTAFTITNLLLLLPLSILVLYLGFQRWRRQRRVSAATTMSHSDVFTYHMVAIELNGVIGSSLYCCGIYMHDFRILFMGLYILSVTYPGQVLIHCLTCIERYLAVVHPITYLSLRKAGGIRFRNISIGFVWLLSFGWLGLIVLDTHNFPFIPFLLILAFFLVVNCFCSLSILRILIRPGPGEVCENRERVDQSKQRAFYTITAIMGALLVKFVGFLICFGMSSQELIDSEGDCVLVSSSFWFGLPSSLVLPLLFLHRAGKLVCCKPNAE